MKALVKLVSLAVLALLGSVVEVAGAGDKRMIVLGIDGMDPQLLDQFMKDGVVPNLSRLATVGQFIPLGTSVPPQSPVAWSNFITGMDAGGHGIFDFIALDRETLLPYYSVARVEKPLREPLALGRWRLPIGEGKTILLRQGTSFWELLDSRGIGTTIFRVPVNYPPVVTRGRSISGMGTPDLRGSPGTFTYYTDDPSVEPGKVSGGEIVRVSLHDRVIESTLNGPPNPFLENTPPIKVHFSAQIDPDEPIAQIRFGDQESLLRVGEWSDWLQVQFGLIPGILSVPGIVRVLLKQTDPHFSLYISPVNIDPLDPVQPISVPAEYAAELAEATGRFYTQEMPEDTKALSAKVFTPGEFLTQSGIVLGERRRLLRHHLSEFRSHAGPRFLFFYVSSVDQRNHMLARQTDPEHPFHDKNGPPDLISAMRTTYREIDEMVGWILQELDEDTVFFVMSDHGFAPFHKQANLNSWLESRGYLTLRYPNRRSEYDWLQGIDWSRTKAFAIGLNSLYLNVRGRERFGIVEPGEREKLARELVEALQEWTDTETGERIVTQPLIREDVYHGPHVSDAPDILVGYARGYRASWATTSGQIPPNILEDNRLEWSGDHCMDSRVVPGVLLSNRPLAVTAADLLDLPVTILQYFEVDAPTQMSGKSLLPQ